MKELVVKDNALINASYNLDLVEQRLILLAIITARETGKGINANDALEVHASSYINHFNVEKHTAYKVLKQATDDLFERRFSFQFINKNGNVEHVKSRWVSEIRYVENEATVKLIFAPAVVPLITRLEQHFTSYELKQVSLLKSRYAILLYELLIDWRTVGKTPIFELSQFRNQLGIDDSEYQRMELFKRRVLEIAISQINEFTDITTTYEQHKKGRSIYGFSFSFKQKREDSKLIIEPVQELGIIKMTDSQRYMFAKKLSEMPEMSTYSHGTESFEQFAIRIAEMLQDPNKRQELCPYLKKAGYMPSK